MGKNGMRASISPIRTHIYGRDTCTYFVKIHTIPIHGNDISDDCHVRE